MKPKNTLILKGEKIKFKDLLMRLLVHSKGDFLCNVVIYACHVVDCPEEVVIMRRFRYNRENVELFCGFFVEENVHIKDNVFSADKKIPKRKK